MAMFEIIVNVVLSFDNNLIIKNFSYDFDYGKESMELFKKIYASKGIIFDENFKEIYPTFFNIKNIKNYHSDNDSPTYFNFEFKFGEFCNYFKISPNDYYDMYKKGQNYYPFLLIGNIEVKNGEELIDCKFISQMMSSGMFILFYPENDKYFLDYESQNFCVFKLIKNLSENDAKSYKTFTEEYERLGYWFFAPPA